jgi:hypothetical protein
MKKKNLVLVSPMKQGLEPFYSEKKRRIWGKKQSTMSTLSRVQARKTSALRPMVKLGNSTARA